MIILKTGKQRTIKGPFEEFTIELKNYKERL